MVLNQTQENWLLVVTWSQMISGFALLVQVVYSWLKMRKLNTLIRFMKRLLILIFIKSLALLSEGSYLLTQDTGTYHDPSVMYIWTSFEFVNWINTQLVIWMVAMRFYESSIPLKKLELSHRLAEKEAMEQQLTD